MPQNVMDVMEQEETADLILHAGDLEGHEDEIRKMIGGCPFEAVRGNCDFRSPFPKETMVEVAGHMIFITHGHLYDVNFGVEDLAEMARGCGADIAVYGHTHVPFMERKEDGLLILNPGSLSRPRQPGRERTYMVLEVNSDNDKFAVELKSI